MSDSVAGPVIFFSIILGSFILSASLLRMLSGHWPWKSQGAPPAVAPRCAVFPTGPPRPSLCAICGMDDPDHLESRWRTHPVHTDCLEWLMPAGPSFVDEYTNPRLTSGSSPRNTLGGVTAAEASGAIAAMFAADNDRPEHISTGWEL